MFGPGFLTALVILFLATAALVVSGRGRMPWMEGFVSYNVEIEPGFCGVDLPPCPHGTRCVNAYCQTTDVPNMPPTSGLPVLPVGYIV